jgi:hypothetical protein
LVEEGAEDSIFHQLDLIGFLRNWRFWMPLRNSSHTGEEISALRLLKQWLHGANVLMAGKLRVVDGG